jgi:hypothetical protein
MNMDMSKTNVSEKTAKVIRIVTVAPIMAAILLALLIWQFPDSFRDPFDITVSILFLVVFPLLAYPLQPLIPKFKDKGREGQRNLAIIFALFGYVFAVIFALFRNPASGVWIIYLTYLISALFIALFNKVIGLKASGHSCGVAGPVWTLIWFLGAKALFGLIFLVAVYWASIKTRRHKPVELLAGTLIPALSLVISIVIIHFA